MAIETTAWYALILLSAAAVFWVWRRSEARADETRDRFAKLRSLAELALDARDARELNVVVEQQLREIAGPVEARVYVYQRAAQRLESPRGESVRVHAPADAPGEEPESAISLAFRNRMAARTRGKDPQSALQILPLRSGPLLSGEESLGVLTVEGAGLGVLDMPSLEHLAKLCSFVLSRIEHEALLRDRFRAEKLQTAELLIRRMARELQDLEQGQTPEAEGLIRRLDALARAETADRPVPAAIRVETPGQSPAVLLVEGDPAVRRRWMTWLARRDYRVIPVASADEGRDRLARFRFDLLVAGGDSLDDAIRQAVEPHRLVILESSCDEAAFGTRLPFAASTTIDT